MQQSPKRNKKHSIQVKQKMKKKPHTQQIQGINYSYGELKKKNQKFIFTNDRFVILKGQKSIAYGPKLSDEAIVPFGDPANFSKLKLEIPLQQISNTTTQGDELTIQFSSESKQPKWEFKCGADVNAAEWKKIILEACSSMKQNGSNPPLNVSISEKGGTGSIVDNTNSNLGVNGNQSNLTPTKNNGIVANGSQQFSPINNLNASNFNPNGSQNNIYNYSPNQNGQQFNQNQNIPNNYNSQYSQGNNNNPMSSSSNPLNLRSPLDTIAEHQSSEGGKNYSGYVIGRQETNKPQFLNLSLQNKDSPSRIKQEYLRKKEQQQKLKASLNQADSLQKSNVSTRSNRNQKKILDCNWDYQFLKGENEHILIQRFKSYAQGLVIGLIDELALEEKRRITRPVEQSLSHLKYVVGSVQVVIAMLQLNQISSFQDRSTIISSKNVKKMQQEFKNNNYILQITRNKGRFRVPLMIIIEYKGFTALVQTIIHSSTQFESIQSSLQQDIYQLERETKIGRSVFEDEQNLKVLAADQRYYEKLSRSENKYKKYDVCFLKNIAHFLPQDFFAFNRTHPEISSLRSQVVQDEEYEGVLFNGGNLNTVLSRVKVPTEIRDAVTLLTEISKSIPQRIAFLASQLESLDQVFTNSQELSSLLHLSGLNARYLGLLHDTLKENWLKGMVMADIIARSAKYFLRYDLQDSTISLGAVSLETAKQYQIAQVIGWINRVVGSGPDSDGLWRQIYRQAQTYFKCTISREGINIGYLVQALQYHGKIKLSNITLSQPFFKSGSVFSKSQFAGFTVKCKTYDLSFTDHYTNLEARLEDYSFESYEQVRSILNIEKRGLEPHYFLKNTHNKIILFLTNRLTPKQAPYLYQITDTSPSKHFYQLQLTAIKWELKDKNADQAERIKELLVGHVNKWLGECHPILAELFEIFSRYYLNLRDQEKKAINYCRNALKNQQKLLGGSHVKLADAYYSLGQIYQHYSKKVEALQAYKKSAQILTLNKANNTKPFAEISIKVSQLYLANNAIADAIATARQALSVAEELKDLDLYLNSAEILGRCLQVSQNWDESIRFVNTLQPLIPLFKEKSADLERVLKTIFFPIFHNIATKSRESCKAASNLLSELQPRVNGNNNGYLFIKQKIEEKVFPSIFFDYLDNIETILKQINSNSILTRWKGFQQISKGKNGRQIEFLSMIQALNCFLSGNFIEGIFSQQL